MDDYLLTLQKTNEEKQYEENEGNGNFVYLKVDKCIKGGEDLELVIIYFQLQQETGGSQIISYDYNSASNMIKVNYLSDMARLRVLKNKYFTFRGYTFTAIDCSNTTVDKTLLADSKSERLLIVQGIAENERIEDLRLYLQLLVPGNRIIFTEKSKIYANTVYVHFEINFLYNQVCSQLQKYPTFRKKFITISNAYNTNLLFIKYNHKDNEITSASQLNACFDRILNENKNNCNWRSPVSSVVDLKAENADIAIIKFDDILSRNMFLLKFGCIQRAVCDIENGTFTLEKNLNNYLYEKSFEKSENKVVAIQTTTTASDGKDSLKTMTNSGHTVLLDLTVDDSDDDVKHLTTEHLYENPTITKLFRCKKCPYFAYQSWDLANHVKRHVYQKNHLKCLHCDYYFPGRRGITQHERLHRR